MLTAKASELATALRGDKYAGVGMVIAPEQQKTLEKLTVQMPIPERAAKGEGQMLPILFVYMVYDAPEFSEPRLTMNAFELHTGDAGKSGLTTEFFSPGVWLKDLAKPLEFIRITPSGDVDRLT